MEKVSFSQNDHQVFDSQGNRLIMCVYCGKIDKTKEFVSYGGKDTMNTGVCYDCYDKRQEERKKAFRAFLNKEKEKEGNGI